MVLYPNELDIWKIWKAFCTPELRQIFSCFFEEIFPMNFPTPLLASHALPQDFVGFSTNPPGHGVWYSILQQGPLSIYSSSVASSQWARCSVAWLTWRYVLHKCTGMSSGVASLTKVKCHWTLLARPTPPQFFCGPVKDPLELLALKNVESIRKCCLHAKSIKIHQHM